jgi:spermidine synthase
MLTLDGLACVWVPSYQTDTEVFKLILRSYLEVFPDAIAYCGLFDERLIAIALISDHRWLNSAENWFQQRERSNQLQTELESVDLPDAVSLLGHLVADNETLRTYAGTGLLNRDDLPAITYLAPQYVYQRYPRPSERFLDLNQIFQARRKEFLQQVPGPISERLNDYWLARDLYFEAMQLSHSDKTDALLRSLQASSEFPEAYREALKVARALEADNLPKQAVTWLKKVIAARPQSEEAKILLDGLER